MTDTVETAIYRLQVEGQDKIDRLKTTLDGLTTSEEKSTEATRTSSQALQNRLARMDPLIRAQEQYRKELESAQRYAEAGVGTDAQRAAQVELATRRYNDQVEVIKKLNAAGAGTKVTAFELQNLGYQINDVVSGLLSGQRPFQVIAQQGGQIGQIFATSSASLKDFAREGIARITSFITPMRLLVGTTVAAGAAAAVMAYQYSEAQDKVEKSVLGIGRRTGTSGSDINKFASDNSSPVGLSVREAREAAIAFVQTGQVAVSQIKGLGDAVYGFSILTGKDAPEAARTLAKALSGDLVAGAKELDQAYGALDGRTLQYVATLQATGERQMAQQIIVNSLAEQNKKAADSVGVWTKAYNLLANAASAAADQLGKTLTFQLPGDRRSPLDVASDKNKSEFVQTSQAGDDAVRSLLPQLSAYEKLLKLREDLNRASESNGAQGIGGFNEEAKTAADNTAAATKEALDNAIRYNDNVKQISASLVLVNGEWVKVGQSTAMQLDQLQNQLPVLQAIGNAARMEAQYYATINQLRTQGKPLVDAIAIAQQQYTNSQAAAVAQSQQQTEAMREQNDLRQAAVGLSGSAALSAQQEVAAQQTFYKVFKDTGDEREAQNRAYEVARSYQFQINDALDQEYQARQRNLQIQQQQAEADVARLTAIENAQRAASSFNRAADYDPNNPSFGSFSVPTGSQYQLSKSPPYFGPSPLTPNSQLQGIAVNQAYQTGGIDAAIRAAVGSAKSGGVFGIPGSGPDYSALFSNLSTLYDLKNAQTTDKNVQAANIRDEIALIQTLPETIARDQQLATLVQSLNSLTSSTDSLNSTMSDALSPYYSQDPRTSHIGFRTQGMATGGEFTVPGGYSANDNMIAQIPVASGEIVSVRRPGQGNAGGPTTVTISPTIVIQGNADQQAIDAMGRTVYQNAQAAIKQFGAATR